MSITEWRRERAARRADRLAVRAEQSRGDSWLEYRRRRRASKRGMRAERRAEGRTGEDIQPDKGYAQNFDRGGFFTKERR
jgi:hypothetical protein